MKDLPPKHVGIIMDGNRRWAKQRGLTFAEGYEAGYQALKTLLEHVREIDLEYLSVYAFSTENWQREKKQVDWLMHFVGRALEQEINLINQRGIRLKFVGNHQRLTPKLRVQLEDAEKLTDKNTAGTLAVCFNYGGQQEITDAVKNIIEEGVNIKDIGPETIEEHLYTPEIPPLDLIIRTSGEHRLSNFMLWRSAYSELYFLEKHWPDFTANDLDEALEEYSRRQRRMGV